MNKRITDGQEQIRTVLQLGTLLVVLGVLVVLLDARFRVLPQAIHNHLPVHHDGFVITDITIHTCSKLNPFGTCRLDSDAWHRIDKNLYLDQTWSSAYIHIKRSKEEDLGPQDHVLLDVRVGRQNPSTAPHQSAENVQWESRPGGLWLHRSSKRHDSDSDAAITAVDVLFGADAAEPRPGWRMRDTPLLLDSDGTDPKRMYEAHISLRSGEVQRIPRPVPRIRKDGRFKILQLSDLHLSTGVGKCRDAEPADHSGHRCYADPRTLDFVERILDDEQPDLVVLSGDQVNGETAPDVPSALYKVVHLLTKRTQPIPWAAIFGNHDDQGKAGLDRTLQMRLMQSLPYSLAEPGPAKVDGVGNYVVEVLAHGQSHHSALTIYLLDSHSYSPNEHQYPGYDWLKESQITWFKETANALKRTHAKYTKIHLNMAFIHIPLPEYSYKTNSIVGSWREGVTAPGLNTGFRDALVEEHVVALSCGHDHVNDYCALSQRDRHPELWMCYGGGAGFGGYGGHGGYHRRVRVFEIDSNEARISTWKRVEWGDVRKRIDEQVIVDGGHVVGVE